MELVSEGYRYDSGIQWTNRDRPYRTWTADRWNTHHTLRCHGSSCYRTSPKLILNWLPLTEAQLDAALSYIEANRAEVEAKYQEVLQTAEAIRQYWKERNHEHFARIAALPPKLGQEALWIKLQAQKARHAVES